MPTTRDDARRRVSIERTFDATVAQVWELWTTKDGIESWWGPDGFRVEVRELDLRTGGRMAYAMIATAPDQIEFLRKAGMPLTNECVMTFTDVDHHRRLAYRHLADFIPGVQPYEVAHEVALEETPRGVRMVLTFDAMHDEQWTHMATMGWENELDKLAGVLTR